MALPPWIVAGRSLDVHKTPPLMRLGVLIGIAAVAVAASPAVAAGPANPFTSTK